MVDGRPWELTQNARDRLGLRAAVAVFLETWQLDSHLLGRLYQGIDILHARASSEKKRSMFAAGASPARERSTIYHEHERLPLLVRAR